jgi:hypothetical protein
MLPNKPGPNPHFEGDIKLWVTMRGKNKDREQRTIRLPQTAKMPKGSYHVIVSPVGEAPAVTAPKTDDAFTKDVGAVMDFFMDCLDEKEWGKRFSDLADMKGVSPIISRIQKVLG